MYSLNKKLARDYRSIVQRHYPALLSECRDHTKLIRQSPIDIRAFYNMHQVVPRVKYFSQEAQDLLEFLVKQGKQTVEKHFERENTTTSAIQETQIKFGRYEQPLTVSLETFDETDLDHLTEDPFAEKD